MDFKGIDPHLLSHKRVMQLSHLEFRIFIMSFIAQANCLSRGVGIFKISTTDFEKGIKHEIVQDYLGRTDLEVALLLGKRQHELTEEDKKKKVGILTKKFPDLIEYDPDQDMIFSKLVFDSSSVFYMKTPKSIMENVHKDFKDFFGRTPERWWSEFAKINSRRLHAAFDNINKEDKGFPSYSKTFEKLFELERNFSPSQIPSPEVSIEKINKLRNIFEKSVEI